MESTSTNPLLSPLKRSRAEQRGANANINADTQAATTNDASTQRMKQEGCCKAVKPQQSNVGLNCFLSQFGKILDQNMNA